MPTAQHRGSCLCGRVQFDVEGDFEQFFLCHCSRCRKGTGSAHAANLFSKSALLQWRSGLALVRSHQVPGTRHTRSFCSQCGAAMPAVHPFGLVVPAGALDTPVDLAPTAHIFCASRAEWEDTLSEAPRHDTFPGR